MGAIVTAGAAILGGISQQRAAQYQASVARRQAEYQATLAEQVGAHDARAALTDARAEEARYRRLARRRIASATAAYGGSGAQLVGTPLDALADQMLESEEEALLIRHAGKTEASRIRYQSRIAAQTARLGGQISYETYRYRGRQVMLGGIGQAMGEIGKGVGTLLTG
jgi:hypothetical protein